MKLNAGWLASKVAKNLEERYLAVAGVAGIVGWKGVLKRWQTSKVGINKCLFESTVNRQTAEGGKAKG